jgi:hypothetical protein
MSKLDRNLHALAIGYRILGGLIGLVLFLTILMFSSAAFGSGSVALLGIALQLLLLVVGATIALAAFEVASSLQNHERRTFCLVAGWLVCAAFPLGTVLGVFTILQLIQPEAERVFAEAEASNVKREGFGNQESDTAV